jgi:NAD-dependent SIR2 family protein deacetylase
MAETIILELDQFIRSIEINKDQSFSIFLGAGASTSSGIPSAGDCIWHWKQKIYTSQTGNNLGTVDFKSDNVRKFIQKWLDNEGSYPQLNDDSEYSTYIEKCYPIEDDRRSYFKNVCEKKEPSIGYHLLALLHELGLVHTVWTTNFDDLCSHALTANKSTVIDIALDTVDRVHRPYSSSELLLVKLHGDYKFGPLKNTSPELQRQDETFRQKLIDYLNDKHLIVFGYSGRDDSVLEALEASYTKKGAGRLYWCGYSRDPSSKVKGLIELARASGRTAFYIPTDGFDKAMISLAGACTKHDSDIYAKFLARLAKSNIEEVRSPFSMSVPYLSTIIKSNLFEIRFPQEVFQFDFTFRNDEKPWQTLRSITANSNVVAVPHSKQIWSLGTLSEINTLFGERISGKVNRIPIAEIIPRKETALHHLLMSCLTKLLSSGSNLQSNNKDLIWKTQAVTKKMIDGTSYFSHSAIRLSLVFDGYKHFLSMLPDVYITAEDRSLQITKEIRTGIGRAYFEKLFNKQFNDYINEWRTDLFKTNDAWLDLEFPDNSGTGFIYKIRKNQAFAKVMKLNEASEKTLAPTFSQNLLYHGGIQYAEPNLIFSSRNVGMKNIPSDFHPMRGLSVNRPYDHDLVGSLFEPTIKLGVICSKDTSGRFDSFINRVQTKTPSGGRNQAYLIDYPGFFDAYGVSLNIPEKGTENWLYTEDPQGASVKAQALSLRNNITRKIDEISADGIRKVILICIPTKWIEYCSYDIDNEHFDLHDYIKAYCAEKSIATQFIQESTIDDSLHCQINWWLSLSYFVKSLRTPWALNTLDKDTAFAGVGYSISKKTDSTGIVLGCSHIYNSKGQGLKYRLSKVEDQLIWDRLDRPHLSYKDSYSFGMSIIDLFYTTMNALPRRVVIHKRNYFMPDEIKGLKESLIGSGIKDLDLIEINFEEDIRYVAGTINQDGIPGINSFPIDRGTSVLLNRYEALLWTHGAVPSVQNPRFNYYLGGRYIPGPLKVIKHFGPSNIGVIANEILGLTKVNWNSFDMYTQLPATINSSREIARIGKLLSKREGATYDYRYFI